MCMGIGETPRVAEDREMWKGIVALSFIASDDRQG